MLRGATHVLGKKTARFVAINEEVEGRESEDRDELNLSMGQRAMRRRERERERGEAHAWKDGIIHV
jgi:hypothetical protein